MDSAPRPASIAHSRRKALVASIPGFANMADAMLTELASTLTEEQFGPGTAVVSEGELGDRLYLIEEGEAEVTTSGLGRSVALARLARGDMFGEIALLTPLRRRQATVTAQTPLVTLSLLATVFEKALAAYPEARIDIAVVADTLLTQKFLKQKRAG